MATDDQLFDLVAPIAIYHAADVCFKPQARQAIKKLRRLVKTDGVVQNIFHPPNTVRWADYLEWVQPDGLPNAVDLYNRFFQEIVEDEKPDWESFYDRWGARGYRDEEGREVFSGDSCFSFPWYETAALLRERIREDLRN